MRGAVRLAAAGFGPYALLAVALIPSCVWIAVDEHVWPWDQAWYGQVSVELFYTLLYSPLDWPTALFRAFAIKAPGIAWLGQWMVPLAGAVGGTDRVLLVSILITQLATLCLLYRALSTLRWANRGVAFVSVLLVGGGPLFVGLTHQYVVEPLQTFVVAWFVFLMVRGRTFEPTELLLQLVAASGAAMLAKVTSPLYCIGPGLVVLYEVYRGYRGRLACGAGGRRMLKTRVALAALGAVVFGLGAVGWYKANFQTVVAFTMLAYSSPVAALYGAHDTFGNKLGYWLGALRTNFVYVPLAYATLPLVLLAIGRRLALDRTSRLKSLTRLDLCVLIAAFEALLVLTSFSAADNEENRYLLPLSPYVAVLLAWVLVQIGSHWVTIAAGLFILVQAVFVNAQALALVGRSSEVSAWLYPVDRNPAQAREVAALVDTTCTLGTRLRYTIVGVEEPWFNANTMAYVSAVRHEPQNYRCYYTSLGYAESNADRAWDRLVALNTLYFVTLAPDVGLNSPPALNQVSAPILTRVKEGGEFDLVPATDDAELLLFRHRER